MKLILFICMDNVYKINPINVKQVIDDTLKGVFKTVQMYNFTYVKGRTDRVSAYNDIKHQIEMNFMELQLKALANFYTRSGNAPKERRTEIEIQPDPEEVAKMTVVYIDDIFDARSQTELNIKHRVSNHWKEYAIHIGVVSLIFGAMFYSASDHNFLGAVKSGLSGTACGALSSLHFVHDNLRKIYSQGFKSGLAKLSTEIYDKVLEDFSY